MSKEVVFTVPTSEEPYRTYYVERNGGVAVRLAGLMGIGYVGLVDKLEVGNYYFVPPKTLSLQEAREIGIKDESGFYGLVVSNKMLVDKQILHIGEGNKIEQKFAEQVSDLVLPGFEVRGKGIKDRIRKELEKHGRLRVKKLGVSDGRGQRVIEKIEDIEGLSVSDDETVVVEADLVGKKTVSVGRVILGRSEYAFLAHQTNDIDIDDGRDRYTGANPVRVVKGGMKNLNTLKLSDEEKIAVEKSIKFIDIYEREFSPIASRLSFDVLFGVDGLGQYRSGVTDVTGRLGGTCPALMLAIERLLRESCLKEAVTRVVLEYQPKTKIEKGEVVFVNHQTLSIKAKYL